MAIPKTKKILFCIDCMVRGGTELQLAGLIERLDRNRLSPHLLTIRPSPPDLTPYDCPHLAWNVPRVLAPGGIAATVRLARWLKRERFQVVQTYFQDSTVVGGVAARMAGVPTRLACFRDLGFWRTPAQTMLLHRVYPLMTGFLCNAEAVKNNFVENDGIDPSIIKVIPNGIDPDALPWIDHQGLTLNIGIVGNLTRRVKRTDVFIQAAGIVNRIPDFPPITWHIIGDGPLRPEYEAMVAAEGISERVTFAGRISNVPQYLEQIQVGVICSDSEGFSNAILEYMLKGCVPVVTAVGGNLEAIDHGRTGLLVPPNDPAALARAIEVLIRSRQTRRAISRSARDHVEARFSWKKCMAAHAAVYGV